MRFLKKHKYQAKHKTEAKARILASHKPSKGRRSMTDRRYFVTLLFVLLTLVMVLASITEMVK